MIKKLDAFRCFVRIEDEKLFKCQIMPDGDADQSFGLLNWVEVGLAVDQAFLDAVNQSFGTNFTQEDFKSPKLSEEKR